MTNSNSNRQSLESTANNYTPPLRPIGYPCNNDAEVQCPKDNNKLETKRKGDGFWKGCFAALCCCCVLDACF